MNGRRPAHGFLAEVCADWERSHAIFLLTSPQHAGVVRSLKFMSLFACRNCTGAQLA